MPKPQPLPPDGPLRPNEDIPDPGPPTAPPRPTPDITPGVPDRAPAPDVIEPGRAPDIGGPIPAGA